MMARTQEASIDRDPGELALHDFYKIFNMTTAEKILTRDILDQLGDMDERPWSDFQNKGPLDDRQLGRLLKPFGIHSRNIRRGKQVRKGYFRSDFEDAWKRYAVINPAATPLQPAETKPTDVADRATNQASNATSKEKESPDCSGVADKSPLPVGQNESDDTSPSPSEGDESLSEILERIKKLTPEPSPG